MYLDLALLATIADILCPSYKEGLYASVVIHRLHWSMRDKPLPSVGTVSRRGGPRIRRNHRPRDAVPSVQVVSPVAGVDGVLGRAQRP